MGIEEGMDRFSIGPLGAADRSASNGPIRAGAAAGSGEQTEDLRRLEETAKQFEGLLLEQVFKQMKEATEQLESEEDEDSGEAAVGEQYKSMFWTFLGQSITQQGGFGLWESIYDQMVSQAGLTDAADLSGLDERV
jgi:Rod binding domain-containing protein